MACRHHPVLLLAVLPQTGRVGEPLATVGALEGLLLAVSPPQVVPQALGPVEPGATLLAPEPLGPVAGQVLRQTHLLDKRQITALVCAFKPEIGD